MRKIVVLLGLVCTCYAANAADLPPELAYLEGLTGDETQLVDAAHAAHLGQLGLIQATVKSLDTLPASQAEGAHATIRRRLDLIDAVWQFTMRYYPQNARANNYYGEFLYDYTNRKLEAVTYWRKSSNLDKSYSSPLNNLGIHYFHSGRARMGNEFLTRALELDPKNPDYNFNIAQNYLNYFPQLEKVLGVSKQKIYKEAMKYSEKAAKYAPEDFEILQDYAVNFFAAQNFDVKPNWRKAAEAWATAREQSRHDQDVFFTHLNEGRVWLRDEDYKRAAQSFEAALTVRADSDIAQQLLAQAREKK